MPKAVRKNSKAPVKENNQWVLIVPESEVSDVKANEQEPNFVKLRHPKTDHGAMFMFTNDNTSVLEVLRFEDDYRSWFVGETVQEDGSLYMTTPIDPLFLVLPYLIRADQSGMFMTLDQIVSDEDYPQCSRIVDCTEIANLNHIADWKGNDDIKAYRFSKTKTLDWLKMKVERTADVLKEKHIYAGSGAKVETFVRSKKDEATRDDYLRYAHGLISDYINPDLGQELHKYLGIQEKVEETKTKLEEPPAKKARIANGTEPEEDYTKFNSNGTKNTQADKAKQTAAQKALQKVDKTGMKSITSFFSKPKKTVK
ncbi:ribonuclease H2 subunit B-like [Ptychodera flava]|uniref:ribonuclease H2 subunit B-like n=1 Tax=Ptychodera flava TaxID=63121 RepID=UPI00396A41AE